MPLTKRIVEAPCACPTKPELLMENTISGTNAESSFQKTNLMQLTRLLNQLSHISQYANELFNGLIKQSNETSERINNIKSRIDKINSSFTQVEKKMGMMTVSTTANPELLEYSNQDEVPEANLFTKDSESLAIIDAYQKCKDLPNFSEIDQLRSDGLKCSKLYSNPEFFIEQWMAVMNKDIEDRKKKREERKKDKIKLRKEKKIRELAKKQYNSDGEIISQKADQEQKTDNTTSVKEIPPNTMATEDITMTQSSTLPPMNNTFAPAPPSLPTINAAPSAYAPPPPPAVPSLSMNINAPPPPPPSMAPMNTNRVVPPPPPPAAFQLPTPGASNMAPMNPMASMHAVPPPPPANVCAPPPPPPPAAPGAPPPPPIPAAGIPPPPPPGQSASVLPTTNTFTRPVLNKAKPIEPVVDTRSSLMDNIKMGGFKLRKVEIKEKPKENEYEGRNDVAALLIRRVALEDSDSESDDSEEDSDEDWD